MLFSASVGTNLAFLFIESFLFFIVFLEIYICIWYSGLLDSATTLPSRDVIQNRTQSEKTYGKIKQNNLQQCILRFYSNGVKQKVTLIHDKCRIKYGQ